MVEPAMVVWPKGMHYSTFIDQIEAEGYGYFGCGAFAEVYTNSQTKRAVKIGKKDDEYLVFAKAVFALEQRRKSRNPYLPLIYNLTIHSTWYMVEMELLKRLKNSGRMQQANQLMDAIYKVVGDVGDDHCPRDIAEYVTRFDSNVWELAAIIGIVLKHQRRDIVLDVHKENVMLRGSQLVVTDPICGDFLD